MTLSAAYTVNGESNPGEHSAAFASTVNLALLSVSGISLIEWSIVAASDPAASLPAITPAGVPSGATASFTMGATSASGIDVGVGYLVKCRVSNTNNEFAEQYSIVGTPGLAGIIPLVPGEEFARHATHGWGPALMRGLDRAGPTVRAWIKFTGGNPGVEAFVSRDTALLVGDFTVTNGGSGKTTVAVPPGILTGLFPPIATISAGGTGAFYASCRPAANGATIETYNGAGVLAGGVDFLLDIW